MDHEPEPTKPRAPEGFDAFVRLLDGTLAFTAADGRTMIRIPAASPTGYLTYSIRSEPFRNWFFAQSTGRYGRVPTTRHWFIVCSYLEAQANRDPRTRNFAAFRRAAARDGNVLVDLSNPKGEFIEITPELHRVKTGDEGVPFETAADTIDLPEPEPPVPQSENPQSENPLDTFRSLLNLGASLENTAWLRCLAWLLAAFRANGPFPILILRGPSGCGKSFAARILRSVIDP